jgi:hypothetical protein
MRIEPPLTPGNFSYGGPSLSVAAEATLFSQLAALAPTSDAAATPPGQKMTPQQINTYWLFRALSDFSMLALTQSGQYSSTAYQPYLRDLQYILNQNPPVSLDPSIMADLKNYTTGMNYTNIPSKISNIVNDFKTVMSSGSPNYNFISFTQDQMLYFYTFQTSYALATGSEVRSFWSSGDTTSPLGTSMGEFISTYFYERNLNPDGTENYTGLETDLNAFMAQFQPMITAYEQKQGHFRQYFPGIFDMLNGGADKGGTPYDGLYADLEYFKSGKWPFSMNGINGNPAPTIPLNTPPPPWDNPNSSVPPVFIYPTGNDDPGCNFFTFVDGFLSEFFQS